MCLRFDSVVPYELACDTEPLAVLECTDLNLRVSLDLPGYSLDPACLDVELILEDIDCSERSYSGLVALDGCKVIGLCFFQKFVYFVLVLYLLIYVFYSS